MAEGFVRPPMVVLAEDALLPAENLVVPAPNQFTHEVTQAQPYYLQDATKEEAPAGEFPAGTQVVLMVYDGEQYCRVVDGQGLYVEIEYACLRRL